MANHKSAKKAHLVSLKNKARNTSILSRVKTFSGKVDGLIVAKDFDNATTAFRTAESEIMKAVTKGVLKLNTASRKVSRLAKKVKNLEKQYSA